MATLETQHYISAPLRERSRARWPRALVLTCLAFLLVLFVVGCKSNSSNPANATSDSGGVDPAAANMAPATNNGQPAQALAQNSSYAPQQQSESYEQQGGDNQQSSYNNTISADENAGEQAVDETDQSPPPLPEYDQPPAPDPDYLWTPGYWAWGPEGYYWVPGVWCPPPYYGALWTPPYWGWYGGHYRFHRGYWGPHVGFYGGVDYGFGYIGIGYFGCYWRGHDFYYNREVNNVGHINNTYVYNRTVVYNNVRYSAQPSNRVSYNGGRGGINVAPRPTELAAMHESHARPVAAQKQVVQAAAGNRQQFYNQNHGRPAQAALDRPTVNNQRIAEPSAAITAEKSHSAETQLQQRSAEAQQHNSNVPASRAVAPQQPNATQQRIVGAPQHTDEIQHQTQQRPENRPEATSEARPTMQTRLAAQSRPEAIERPAPEARPESRPQPTPRPEAAPRQEMAPRSAAPASRPEPAPRPEAAPRPQPAPHAEAPAPRPAPAPASHAAPAGGAGHDDHPH